MSKINYYTPEGLQNLKDQLYELKTVQRPSISQQIGEARDKGDLSENAEYDAAKEAQGILEMKISKLEAVISNARLIDDTNIDNSKVYILSKVKIKNVKNGMEIEQSWLGGQPLGSAFLFCRGGHVEISFPMLFVSHFVKCRIA